MAIRKQVKKAVAKKPAKAPAKKKLRVDPAEIARRLAEAIPNPHVELHFTDPWRLLVATILSAQSTDKMVNTVTPKLFERWPTPKALAAAPQEEVEQVVKSTGFFRNKAKAIRGASAAITEQFGGKVPRTMEQMLEIPGVARKTANVVLGAAHGVASGIVVDTHAMRVSQRLGLTHETTPEKIERDLCAAFPEKEWISVGHRLVLHGRHWCTARKPKCEGCALNEICPSREADPKGSEQERGAAEAREMESRAEGFTRAVR